MTHKKDEEAIPGNREARANAWSEEGCGLWRECEERILVIKF